MNRNLVFAVSAWLAGFGGSVAAGPYHVQEGYFGEAAISAKGSCGFAPVRFRSAWFGQIYDDTDTPYGWGIITANGDLVVWEEDYAPLLSKQNDETGVGKDVSYTSMVGVELYDMIRTYSGCSIQVLEPDRAARSTMQWDKFRGKDNIRLDARFGGFEASVCRDTPTGTRCAAHGYTGTVTFSGRYAVPD